MTKEELEKEAREYLAEHTKYSEIFGEFFVAIDTLTAMVDFAQPREKQIQIDAEQIRALQRQNGELTDKVKKLEEELEQAKKVKVVEHFEAYGQCRDSRRIAELEAQIKKMRNCANCKNYNGNEGFCVLGSGYGYNCNLEKWEIKEK